MGVLYPCFCTRREIQAEIERAGGAPQGDGGPAYPGICRGLTAAEVAARDSAGLDFALRHDIARALALTGPLHWLEEGGSIPGRRMADPTPFGDVILARKDIPASYHLAVTLDDSLQGVTLVSRPRRRSIAFCKPCSDCRRRATDIIRCWPTRLAGVSPSATAQ